MISEISCDFQLLVTQSAIESSFSSSDGQDIFALSCQFLHHFRVADPIYSLLVITRPLLSENKLRNTFYLNCGRYFNLILKYFNLHIN